MGYPKGSNKPKLLPIDDEAFPSVLGMLLSFISLKCCSGAVPSSFCLLCGNGIDDVLFFLGGDDSSCSITKIERSFETTSGVMDDGDPLIAHNGGTIDPLF